MVGLVGVFLGFIAHFLTGVVLVLLWPFAIAAGMIAIYLAVDARRRAKARPQMGGGSIATIGAITGLLALIVGAHILALVIFLGSG